MPRYMLSDELWSKLKRIMLQFSIYDKRNLRMMVEGILYRMRVGCPWRDIPEQFGKWNSVYRKFNVWSKKGIWRCLLDALIFEPDLEWVFIDGSYVKAHQHSAGAIGKSPQAIGKSRAGRTSKIHLAIDAYGLPIAFNITGGEVNDCTEAPGIIESLPGTQFFIMDKGYESERIRDMIEARGSKAVIPRKRNSKRENPTFDRHLYKQRHTVENAFANLKRFRGVATRYDKLGRNYESTVAIACSYLWLPM
ncbi:MAG: IS5 family transposase [Hahellaceae bacterium]|nr:IS5 family transposase [Hahellaceae bacterium]